jgi:hypothetical protein
VDTFVEKILILGSLFGALRSPACQGRASNELMDSAAFINQISRYNVIFLPSAGVDGLATGEESTRL